MELTTSLHGHSYGNIVIKVINIIQYMKYDMYNAYIYIYIYMEFIANNMLLFPTNLRYNL